MSKDNISKQPTAPAEPTVPAVPETQPATAPSAEPAPAAVDPEREARRAAAQAELDAFAARGAITSKDSRRIHELRKQLAE